MNRLRELLQARFPDKMISVSDINSLIWSENLLIRVRLDNENILVRVDEKMLIFFNNEQIANMIIEKVEKRYAKIKRKKLPDGIELKKTEDILKNWI